MNSVVGPSVSPNAAPQPAAQSDETLAPQALNNGNLNTEVNNDAPTPLPSAGNGSGLLQNFVLPRTSLDALGLLRPSNQGDSEVLISQVSLIAEELAGDSESAQSEANGAAAAALSAFLQGVANRIAELQTQNADAQDRIEANQTTIQGLDSDIAALNTNLNTLTVDINALNAQIAALQNTSPMTPDVSQQIQALTNQVQTLTAQANQIRGQITTLEARKAGLEGQIALDTAQIAANDSTIAAQAQNALASVFVLASLREALQSPSESIDAAQNLFLEEIISQDVEEFLPNMQQIFEADFEDAQIQEMIEETDLTDDEISKAVTVSFGLLGSFYEGLGIFLQQANLVELDLDSVARGNNESQRMQIAL